MQEDASNAAAKTQGRVMNERVTLPPEVEAIASGFRRAAGRVLWLTGAGISAESGIPTFRGEEGYWRVGSRHYHPQEMATHAAFERMPEEVWAWYLYRRSVCHEARPNAAHLALARLEAALGDRFLLVTQNVDGLHLRAGHRRERVYEIHGNLDFMRGGGLGGPTPLPAGIPSRWERGRPLEAEQRVLLTCPDGSLGRPHVLWFDECYDEENYRLESALAAAGRCDLLVVVGTTGGTNLPLRIGELAAARGIPAIAIDPEPNPFTERIERTGAGAWLQGRAGRWVPALAEALAGREEAEANLP